jgi:hypothetical protein
MILLNSNAETSNLNFELETLLTKFSWRFAGSC